MRRAARAIARSLLAAAAGTAVFVGLLLLGLLVGGTECDRGECNWFGELATDTAPLYPLLSLAIGVAVGLALARPRRR